MAKIKKGDTVKVMRGKDAGKTGEVLRVIYTKFDDVDVKLVVKGINIVKKSQKPNPQLNLAGGILEFEKPINISNVMLMAGDKATRVSYEVDKKTNKKTRIAKKTGKAI